MPRSRDCRTQPISRRCCGEHAKPRQRLPDATRAVDWEQRIDFPRLRQERLDRAKAALAASDLGAVLLFDPNNIRYVTSTHIGEWARDKNARFTLLMREPIRSSGTSDRRPATTSCSPRGCLPRTSAPGVSPMRGAMPDETGIRSARRQDRQRAPRARLLDEPLGVDMADLVTLEALGRAGVQVTDGSQVLLAARTIKTPQEIMLSTSPPGSSTPSTTRSTGCFGRACTSTRSSRAPTSCCSRWDRAGGGRQRGLG